MVCGDSGIVEIVDQVAELENSFPFENIALVSFEIFRGRNWLFRHFLLTGCRNSPFATSCLTRILTASPPTRGLIPLIFLLTPL